jgi:sirohydrochlorin cobaltochelatase
MADRAVILFAHGSRDARWAEPLEAVRARLEARGMRVASAFLELMTPDLAGAVTDLAAEGVRAIEVVPIFLGQGGHVREDLPRLVDAVRARHPDLDLRLTRAAGEDDGVLDAIADYCERSARR